MKPFKRLLKYLSYSKAMIVFILISVIFAVSCELAQPFILGKALDLLLVNNDFTSFIIYIVIAISLAILGIATMYLFEYLVGRLFQEATYKMRLDIYKKINDVSVDTLYRDRTGNIIQYEIADIENISNGINAVFRSLFRGVLAIAFTIVLMFVVNWILALVVIILTPLSVVVSRFIAKSNHKYFKSQAAYQSKLNELSLESISSSEILQSFNKEDDYINEFKARDEELRKKGVLAQFAASWVNPSTRLVNNTIYVIVGILGISMIYVSGLADLTSSILSIMSLGKLSSFLSYTNQYGKPFNEISSVISEYEIAKSSLERINDFLNKEDDIDEGKLEISDISSIKFRDVSFSYEIDKPLIEGFNLDIKKGEKLAIVGPTGAGKTTLINILLRYYDVNKGDILFNDVSTKEISKSSLRSNFGLVLQDTWIFNGTILDNVRYAKMAASDEEVIEACKRGHAHELIMTLPYGYNTLITSKDDLSEGEKQIISLARVILLNPDVIVLDEATSNIDTHTEELINEAFDELMKDKTSIVIAHRLSTIVNADTILVINDGKIVEQGSHKELIKKNGLYCSMYMSQFK